MRDVNAEALKNWSANKNSVKTSLFNINNLFQSTFFRESQIP